MTTANSTYIVTLKGTMTAESPLATTLPPLRNRTVDMEQPSPLPKMVVNYGDQRVTVPYMPGSGIRGRLRRCAVDLLKRAYPDGMKLQDYYFLAIGGGKGADAENKADLGPAKKRREDNPIVGLFGAGAPWSQGRLSVSHAVPETPISEDSITGVRIDDIGRPGGLSLLTPGEQSAWVDMAYHNSERSKKEAALKRLKDELGGRGRSGKAPADADRAGLQTRIDTLTQEIAEHSARAYATHSVLRPLPGYEFIPQGTRLTQNLTLTHANRMEIGAFVCALREFAFNPVIGGRAAHHNGVVSARWAFAVRDSLSHDLMGHGDITIAPYEGLNINDDFLDGCARDFLAALETGRFDFAAPVVKKGTQGDGDDES